ncbi:PH domain-containing protein [Thalassiella azotivora]
MGGLGVHEHRADGATGGGAAEQEVVTVRPHASCLVPPALVLVLVGALTGVLVGLLDGRPPALGAAVAAVLAVVVLRFCVRPFARWWTTTTRLTTRRLVLCTGTFSRHRRDVPLSRVVAVDLRRTLRQRLTGAGTLVLQVEGAGEGRSEVVLAGLPWSQRLQDRLSTLAADCRRAERGTTGAEEAW